MKSIRLIFAVLLLCVSQFAMAAPTPAQQAAISAALGSGPSYTQAQVEAAVQAAAAGGVSVADAIAFLHDAGISGDVIVAALVANINSGLTHSYTANDADAINAALAANGISATVSVGANGAVVAGSGSGGDGTPGGQMGGTFGATFGTGTGAGVGGPSGPVSPN